MQGLLPLDKPAGLTSAAALNRLKRHVPRGTKVGHAGTLDLFATGMVLVLIGKATKQCEAMMGLPKTYVATVQLGATTPTLDPTVEPTPIAPAAALPSRAQVEQALQAFRGEIMQTPPDFSALKSGGKRLSDRVRAGETVSPQPRPITIHSIDLQHYADGAATLHMVCSRGTYVRAIARDLGDLFNVGGYLTALRRTAIGSYGEAQMLRLDDVTSVDVIEEKLLPIEG